MATHHEVERTYAPPAEAHLPDLTSLPGVDGVGGPSAVVLEAVYFDTADLALLRTGMTLRRRTGGADQGWHLKVPAGRGRDEIQLALDEGDDAPPQALRELVLGWTRREPLVRVASIRTRRTTYPLLAADGSVLAEVADDEVTGRPLLGRSEPVTWREWEVELVEAGPSLLGAADELLARHGIEPSAVQRKIAMVLGDRIPDPVRPGRPKPGKAAGRVLQRHVVEQVAALHRCDYEIRRGSDEGVHQARVACRRLRSSLATFRPLVVSEVTDPLRAELKWLAGSLGDARDAKVVGERLRHLADDEPAGLVLGKRLEEAYAVRRAAALVQVSAVLTSARYFHLLDSLDRLAEAPPWTPQADLSARKVLRPRLRRDFRRLRRLVHAVDEAADRDVALHEVRKAAKRLRYAAEALEPVWGRDAARLAGAMKAVGTLLGERQDTVMSRRDLVVLAVEATAEGENSFTHGRLHAREAQRAAEIDEEFAELWTRVSRPALRAWLG